MKWIELLTDFDGKSVGETYEEQDAVADALVKTKTAKIVAEPAEVAAAAAQVDPNDLAALVEKSVTTAVAKLAPQGKRFASPAQDDPHSYELGTAEVKKIAAQARRCGSLKSFKNTEDGQVQAYRFGQWFRAICGVKSAQEFCGKYGLPLTRDTEIVTKGNAENNNASGGFIVPIEFDTTLIDLREKYGVFRQHVNATPMESDTKNIPRRKSGNTAYFVGENTAGTESTKNWDQVQLVAKKLMVLTRYSNELSEDAILNIGDDLAGEIAYEFALKEDKCGFVGDGTSTYGGISGVTTKLLAVDTTLANILGLQIGATGTGAAFSGFTLSDFNAVVGKLPEYADGPNCKWYVHRTFWGSVMQKLATAAGGNRVGDIVDGARVKEFLGYEVVTTQVMPKTPAVNTVVALFGDLSKAVSMGDRRMTSIKVSDSALNAFEQDQLIIRGTERFDIVVHDVGESSAGTARDSEQGLMAGPIVGLATASS